MDEQLTAADFAFTGFLAAQTVRYRTSDGKQSLEAERRHTLTSQELVWQRMVEAADRAATQRVVEELEVRRLSRERMLAEIDEDYEQWTTVKKQITNERHAA